MCYHAFMDKKLGNHKTTAQIIRKYDFSFRKRFGQNFLIDDSVLERIVEAAQIGPEDLVIEIGPGIGTLTQYLCEAARQVIAVEIDRDLIPILQDTLSGYDNVRIINEDVLKVDLSGLVQEYMQSAGPAARSTSAECAEAGTAAEFVPAGPAAECVSAGPRVGAGGQTGAVRIVANLPYYITTPILMGLFDAHVPARRITVMVQKEVAERMTAPCGNKEYGSLSVAVQYFSKPHLEFVVPPSCFMPRPKVESAVISLQVLPEPSVTVKDEALFKKVVRAAFGQRRKTMGNAIGNAPDIPASREKVAEALRAMGLSETVRGEALSLAQFGELADRLTGAAAAAAPG